MPARITHPTPVRHYVKEWRKHRKMTLEQIADAIGSTKEHLSRIENYKFAMTNPVAEAITIILRINAETLRSRGPGGDADDELALVSLYRGASPEQRKVMLDTSRSIANLGKLPN